MVGIVAPMRTSTKVIAAVCLVAGIAAGCSGSDDDAAGETSAPATLAPATTVPATTVAASSPSTTGAPTSSLPADAPPVCAELQRVRVLSDEMNEVLAPVFATFADSSTEPDMSALPVAADAMDAILPQVVDAYADAAAVADETLAKDIDAVSKATVEITPLMAEVFRNADSVDDLAELEQQLGSDELRVVAVSGGEAALRIDEVTIPQCGFKFSEG
jgi:hypothetical protein